MKVLMIDPPLGWRFGFPRPYDKLDTQTLKDWLLEKGYPPSMVSLAEEYSRYWTEETTADA